MELTHPGQLVLGRFSTGSTGGVASKFPSRHVPVGKCFIPLLASRCHAVARKPVTRRRAIARVEGQPCRKDATGIRVDGCSSVYSGRGRCERGLRGGAFEGVLAAAP